jgi:hypothetical protein
MSWFGDIFDRITDALGKLVNVNGMSVYNDTFRDSVLDSEGEQMRWTAHPELSHSGPCEYCLDQDGRVYDTDDAPDLPAHVGCQCSWEIVEPDEEATSTSLDDFIDYDDWRDQKSIAAMTVLKRWRSKH